MLELKNIRYVVHEGDDELVILDNISLTIGINVENFILSEEKFHLHSRKYMLK